MNVHKIDSKNFAVIMVHAAVARWNMRMCAACETRSSLLDEAEAFAGDSKLVNKPRGDRTSRGAGATVNIPKLDQPKPGQSEVYNLFFALIEYAKNGALPARETPRKLFGKVMRVYHGRTWDWEPRRDRDDTADFLGDFMEAFEHADVVGDKLIVVMRAAAARVVLGSAAKSVATSWASAFTGMSHSRMRQFAQNGELEYAGHGAISTASLRAWCAAREKERSAHHAL
jgi:hypothetical protein